MDNPLRGSTARIPRTDRREFLRTTALLTLPTVAGCSGGSSGEGADTPTGTRSLTQTGTDTPSTPATATLTDPSTPPRTDTPASTPTPTESGIRVGMRAATATITTLDGREVQLSEYRGQKVMLWLFATWCPSCQQSAQELQRSTETRQSLTILAGRMHKNAGYSGPSVREFAEEYASDTLESDGWVWGTASQATTQTFSPQGVVDIYYLIDKDGIVRTVDTVPGTTIHKIARFAHE